MTRTRCYYEPDGHPRCPRYGVGIRTRSSVHPPFIYSWACPVHLSRYLARGWEIVPEGEESPR